MKDTDEIRRLKTTEEIRKWRDENPDKTLDLSNMDLYIGGFYRANFNFANLSGAILRWACLQYAHFRGASLCNADLRHANLYCADLRGADLSNADLREAVLFRALLNEHTNLEGAKLPHYQIPDGDLIVWGEKGGHLVEMIVPEKAKRTGTLIGRGGRAEYVYVAKVYNDSGWAVSHNQLGGTVIYNDGELAYPDSYDDDPRIEFTHGIHFFLTKAEAEEHC